MKYAFKRNILKKRIQKDLTSCLYSTRALIATTKVEFSYSKARRYTDQMSIGKSIDIDSIQYIFGLVLILIFNTFLG